MSPDVAALTGSVVLGLPDVQACLLLSSDGLPIAAFPPEQERRATGPWLRLSGLGDARRGFVVVGEELWAFATRDGYAAMAIAGSSTRPALVLDRLDRMLEAVAPDTLENAPPSGRSVEDGAASGDRPRRGTRTTDEKAPAAANTVSIDGSTAKNGAAGGQVLGLAVWADSSTCFELVDYEAAPTGAGQTAGVHYRSHKTAANCTGTDAINNITPDATTDTPSEGGW